MHADLHEGCPCCYFPPSLPFFLYWPLSLIPHYAPLLFCPFPQGGKWWGTSKDGRFPVEISPFVESGQKTMPCFLPSMWVPWQGGAFVNAGKRKMVSTKQGGEGVLEVAGRDGSPLGAWGVEDARRPGEAGKLNFKIWRIWMNSSEVRNRLEKREPWTIKDLWSSWRHKYPVLFKI